MNLNIDPFPVLAHKLEGMARVTMHVMVTVRGATVGEQNQKLVNTLRVLRKIILTKREKKVFIDRVARPVSDKCQLTQNMSASFKCV